MDTWVWIVIAIAVVLLVALGAWALTRRRTATLQEDFGGEYDRTVAEAPSRREAEAELRERQKRHDELELQPLDDAARDRFRREWDAAQARFVDEPAAAIGDADSLIQQAMRDRGYPVEDFEQQAADLSVEHGDLVTHYRTAHAISRANVHGEASTEELRQAMVHYRLLFQELVESGEPADVR